MFKKFISYYKPYKKTFFIDMFCAFVQSLADISMPFLIAYMTKTVLTSDDKAYIATTSLKVVAIMFLLYLVKMVCTYYVNYYGHFMGMSMESDMRRDLFTKLSELPFSFYDNNNTGQMASRITNDLFDVTELAHHGPEDIFISIVKIVGSLIILSHVNVLLTFSLLVLVVIIVTFSKFYNKKMKMTLKDSKVKVAIINENIYDSLSGIRVVKSFASEDFEKAKFEKGNNDFKESKGKFYKTMGEYTSVNGFLQGMMYIMVFSVGSFCVYKDLMDSADIILFVLYINTFLDPMKTLINFTELYQKGFTGFKRMLEILEVDNEIHEKENPIAFEKLEGNIVFDKVSFSYKNTDSNVLENVSVDIPKNKKIALVGASGGGKSTFCSLIPRFYDTTEGSIKIDGIDIRDMSLDALRQNIGVVQQDVYIFNTTVKENIAYGSENATMDDIIEASKKANIHDFIMSLPEGYDTWLGERGVRFSGGQKQRISIARVFLKNPPILILDEATAALDNESERFIQKSLDMLSKDRTTIVVAHRLSTIRNSDEILVITDNGVSEKGSHEELMKQNGQYKTLYDLQFDLM